MPAEGRVGASPGSPFPPEPPAPPPPRQPQGSMASPLPPTAVAPKGKPVASDQHIPELRGPTHAPAQQAPCYHSCSRRKGRAEHVSCASFLPYTFGAAPQRAGERWGKHSRPTKCPESIPSSLALETSVQPFCRQQPPAPAPSAPLQTPTSPLAFPRCLNCVSAGTSVPELRRALQSWSPER